MSSKIYSVDRTFLPLISKFPAQKTFQFNLPSSSNLTSQKSPKMIRSLQDSFISRNIRHGTIRPLTLNQKCQNDPSNNNLPQSIKNLRPRNSRYHIHCKSRSSSTCQFLHHLLILRRVYKTDQRSAFFQSIHLTDIAFETRCPDLHDDVGLAPYRFTISQCGTGFFVGGVRKLCFDSSASLNQDFGESFFEKKDHILRCDCYTPFVGECLSYDSYCKVRVWC